MQRSQLLVIEDAAQAIDSYYLESPLGKIGHFGTFSFHESKNISSGEGGLLTVNIPEQFPRAEIIREKGTNRAAFFRGEIAKYSWVDVGSSFLPSDLIAAFLLAQLEQMDVIQKKRLQIWEKYEKGLQPLSNLGYLGLQVIPAFATNNAHLFYILCRSLKERHALADFLKKSGISAVFHYLPLHQSDFYKEKHDGRELPLSEFYSRCLLRLPLYAGLDLEDVDFVIQKIHEFYDLNQRIESSENEMLAILPVPSQ